MSLFDTEVADLSRKYIRLMNLLEANRTSADMVEQIGNLLKESAIHGFAYVLLHDNCNPPQLDLRVMVRSTADRLPRVIELLSVIIHTRGGELFIGELSKSPEKSIFIQLPDLHPIEINFDSKDISREMLIKACDGFLGKGEQS